MSEFLHSTRSSCCRVKLTEIKSKHNKCLCLLLIAAHLRVMSSEEYDEILSIQ